MKKRIPLLFACLLPAACAHQSPTVTAATQPNASSDLAYQAIACWFGPVWGDALGEPVVEHKDNADRRCLEVVRQVWSHDEKGHLERLRALEATAISELLGRVDQLARAALDDKERQDLVTMLGDVAGAERDNMWARRATDRIRIDEGRQRPHQRVSDDERVALEPLMKIAALRALYQLDAGRYTSDAHALAVLAAMDRINVARGLPRHVEIYADEPVFTLLFQVPPPSEIQSDPAVEAAPHVWIDYLVSAAANAGHPIPPTAVQTADRDLLGWAGMLDGIADRLSESSALLSHHLQPVVNGVVHRLQAEAIGDRYRFADEQLRRATPL